mgnify:CR=1 FL=1
MFENWEELKENCLNCRKCSLCEVRFRGAAPKATAADRAHLGASKVKILLGPVGPHAAATAGSRHQCQTAAHASVPAAGGNGS